MVSERYKSYAFWTGLQITPWQGCNNRKAVFPTWVLIYCFISINKSFGQVKYGLKFRSSKDKIWDGIFSNISFIERFVPVYDLQIDLTGRPFMLYVNHKILICYKGRCQEIPALWSSQYARRNAYYNGSQNYTYFCFICIKQKIQRH